MKANRVLLICVLAATSCSALTWTSAWGLEYTWNIAGSGGWGTAANWTPAGVPASGDVILLSNGGTIDLGGSRTVTRVGATGTGNGIVGTLTNGSLHFTNNMYVKSGTVGVNLSNAGGSTGRLWIGGNGAATVVLTGVNTHTYQDNYATIIGHSTTGAAGIVMLGNNNALGGSTNRTDVYSGTLDLNGQNALVQNQIRLMSSNLASLINSNTSADAGTAAEIVLSASNSMGGAGNLGLAGIVSGGGNLTKIGTGMLTLTGANTFTGQITVAAGTLSINNWNTNNSNGPLGNSSSKIVLGSTGSTGTLEFTATGGGGTARRGIELAAGGTGMVHLAPTTGNRSTNYIQIDGANITGSGAFVVDTSYNGAQTSRFIIVGNAAMTGPITVNPYSELQNNLASAGDNTPFGTGTITVSANGILNLYRKESDATAILGGLAGSGRVHAEGGQLKIYKIGANNESTEFSGTIANSASGTGTTVAVTKIGSGTLTLSGVNTFSGPLRVEEGVLALSGANTFTGQITVAAGTLSITSWNADNANGPLGNNNTKIVLGGAGTTGILEYTGGASNSPSTLRGIELATGGVGKVQLSSAGTTRSNHYVHLNGSKIVGSGELIIDTSYNGAYTSRFILVGDTPITGPVTVNPYSELQNNLASAGDNTPFGTGTITVSANGILNLYRKESDATAILGGLAGSGRVHAESSGVKTFKIGANNESTEFSGTIANSASGTGTTVAVTKIGTGTLTLWGVNTFSGPLRVEEGVLALSGANTFTGQVTVAGGTLNIGAWNDNGIAGPLGQSGSKVQLDGGTIQYTGGSVNPNKSLHMAGVGTIDVVDVGTVLNLGAAGSNSLTGSGDITKAGAGTLQLAQASVAQGNWGGKLIINAGTVDFFGSDSMPKPASFVPDAVQINDGGTFAFSYSGTSPSAGSPNTNIGFQLSGNAGFAITAGTHALQGVIADKPGQTGNLIKTGNGTLALAGDNTYTGATIVDAGILLVNGSTHAGSAVTVRTNAALGGTGTVGGAATIQAGGKLATGNSIGTLNFGGPLAFESGAVWDWEYVDNSPGNYDQAVGPQLVLPASGTVTFNIHGLAGHSVFPGDKFTVFTGEVLNFSPDRVELKNYSKWTSWEMSTGSSLVLTADSTISLSTDVLNAAQANPGAFNRRPDGYSNPVGVELVRFIGNSDADPLNVAYTRTGDRTIDVAPWVVGGSARGTSQQLQVNGYAVNSPYTTDLNLYLRGENAEYNEGFGAHANWIVTFDLDVIRAEHFAGTYMPFQLTGEFGTWGGISSTDSGAGIVQGAIFLDGVRIDDMDPSIANPVASIRNLDFDLTILSGRYLTFGIFNGATTVWDDGVFKNVNLTMIPEPGALLMLLAAGVAGLLFRSKRGGSR